MNKHRPAPTYVRKYILKMIAQLARQLGHAEDSVAALAHAGGVLQFIGQTGSGQGLNSAQEIAQTGNSDAAIKLAILVAQADHHVGSTEVWIHRFFQALQQSRIVFQRGNPGDQFCLHVWLSKVEGVDFGYALKYASKVSSRLNQQGGAA